MTWMRWLLPALAVVVATAPAANGDRATEAEVALVRMHDEFVDAFVDSQGFGKRRVTPMMARMRHYQFEGFGEGGRCVLDVELVGVAWHDPPVVHGATFMGFQHRDGDADATVPSASIRGLQTWERKALSRLMAGEDMVMQATPRGERAMGPIRARGQCLACHGGRREGDVLGAFSYGLGRLDASLDDPRRRSCRP
jgi:hypothetical protein